MTTDAKVWPEVGYVLLRELDGGTWEWERTGLIHGEGKRVRSQHSSFKAARDSAEQEHRNIIGWVRRNAKYIAVTAGESQPPGPYRAKK